MSAGLTRRRLLGFAAAAPVCAKAATGASDAGLTSLPQDWDVIVIGSGLAGLTAAVTARESGAERVLVLEKGPLAGGHTLYSAGSIAVLSPKRQKPFGIEDSADLWVQDARKAGQTVSAAHIRRLAEGSEEAVDWLQRHGIVFAETVYQAVGDLHPRSVTALGISAGRRYIITLHSAARRLGVRVILGARALALGRADATGRVSVTAGQPDGRGPKKHLRAAAVVIATGGFTANTAMRLLVDSRLTADIPTTANPEGLYWDGASGDGIRMGRALGAAVAGMENIILLPYAGGRLLDYVGGDIYVNQEGQRFVDESAPVYDIAEAILRQPGRSVWVITDSASRKGASLGLKLTNGTVRRSDTIREAAEGMGVPPAVLERTVREYNEDVVRGRDRRFGKTVFTQTIEVPPFYWGRESVFVHMTLGGLSVTPDAALLDPAGRPIEGFWAAGETTGGIFGRGRPGGMSLAGCLVFGRRAGRSAAERAAALRSQQQ
ncbi:MAG: FAD-dependent oxidoreductase [Sutterella sp.]|nr:FAD-dependent oxidoreductase [Sutterella sp.]